MIYRCSHRHPTSGHQCSHKARANWSTCTRHIDAGQPIVFHDRTRGLRVTIGRTRVRNLDRKPNVIG